MLNSLKPLLLLGAFCSVGSAQLLVDLSVDVMEAEGIYTYTYTLANSDFSFQDVNTFLLTTGKGASVSQISGPDGWVAEYDKDTLPTFQASFIAGDGISCGDGEPSEIRPGNTETFTIESSWAPEIQEYTLGRLVAHPEFVCDWQGEPVLGTIASPSIEPEGSMFEPCDFDEDGDCDLRDIDNLASTIALGDNDATYDMTSDALVDLEDLNAFLDVTNRINGDADFSGNVGFEDFLKLSANFGQENAFWSAGDFSADGQVGFSDFLIVSGNFGQGEVATAAVPEPSSLAPVAVAFLAFSRVRFRRRP